MKLRPFFKPVPTPRPVHPDEPRNSYGVPIGRKCLNEAAHKRGAK